MQFVKIEDLKPGMRIARPIYSKKGVLLYERDSKLNQNGIDSIKNFGLIGLFVLEPAEPAPPMSPADIEFERFQTVNSFAIKDELTAMLARKTVKLPSIVADIIKSYGNLDKKINFVQSLRTKEDYVFRHSLNVAMLSALIGHKYGLRLDEMNETVTSAIVHDIGRLTAPSDLWEKDEWTDSEEDAIEQYQAQGFEILDDMFTATPNIRRIAAQSLSILQRYRKHDETKPNMKIVEGSKVMTVAEYFDTVTAMSFGGKPKSELDAIRDMQNAPNIFDPSAVKALVNAINILTEGISVVLSTGDTALILQENPKNIVRPVVLCFRDNSIMNLADTYMYGDIEVVDIMKTLDNRYVMDKDTLDAHSDRVGS